MQGVRRSLGRSMGVEAILGRRATAGYRGEAAGAALDAAGHRWCLAIGDLERETLYSLPRDLVLGVHLGLAVPLRVGVHGGDSRVVVLGHIITVLRHAGCPLEHLDTRVLLRVLSGRFVRVHLRDTMVLVCAARQAVSVGVGVLLDGVGAHLLAKIGEGGRSLQVVTIGAHHAHMLGRPVHDVALGSRRRLLAAGVGCAVVKLG